MGPVLEGNTRDNQGLTRMNFHFCFGNTTLGTNRALQNRNRNISIYPRPWRGREGDLRCNDDGKVRMRPSTART